MFLQEYLEHIKSEVNPNSPLLQCRDMLFKTFHNYKKMLSVDEYEDLQMDIIILALEAERTYDPIYGACFSTYLFSRLEKLSQDFLTRYTGIKVTKHTKDVVFKGQKIYINKTEYKGE